MAVKERFFLFHGNDAHASAQAVRRWEELFREKYGEATYYRIEADEMTADRLAAVLEEALNVQPLFPQPVLCVVRRTSLGEAGNGGGRTKALCAALDAANARADSLVTIAVWEERELPERHLLRKWFVDRAGGAAAMREFTVPHHGELGMQAERYVAEHGYRLDAPARRWIEAMSTRKEKEQRLARRLRVNDRLVEDERGWWLSQLLAAAVLIAVENRIGRETLERSAEALEEPISVFEILNAIERRQWDKAKALLGNWETVADDGAYFGFYALVRQRYQRDADQGDTFAAQAIGLLADVEIIIKNGLLPHAWVCELLVLRLSQAGAGKAVSSLMPPRLLWLATLPRP